MYNIFLLYTQVEVSRNGEECLLIQVAEAEAESDVASLASSKQGLSKGGA